MLQTFTTLRPAGVLDSTHVRMIFNCLFTPKWWINPQNGVDCLTSCLYDIDDWMSTNRLKLNPNKTQLTEFGTRQQLAKINVKEVQVGKTQLSIGRSAINRSVHLHSKLTMLPNVQNVCEGHCVSKGQLRQLRSVRRALTTDVTKSLMQSLICTRVDYCNSLLTGASTTNIRRFQSVLNSAARFVARRSKFDHIKDFIRDELHWLPVQH